ncbi:MAG TPA: sigma-54 dependent transcriptional regulator, partial [Methylomirabilota bacterium]|nr:sigma-54 dependent transcriptional regulator [Methylomirabilota bacterium]
MSKGRILIVDDEETIADSLELILGGEGYAVKSVGTASRAFAEVERGAWDLAIVDLVLPDFDGLDLLRRLKVQDPNLEVIMITGHGSIPKAVEAMKEGAYSFAQKPFTPDEIILLAGKAIERKALVAETWDLRRRLADQLGVAKVIGRSPTMRKVFELIEAIAPSDASVLIVGESGTGKELIANIVHEQSPRSRSPFIKINCAALPKDLIESELFGYAKGAFTGATTEKPGLLEEANHGSLLLDEIIEMPAALQAKLLRVIEDRQCRRLGSSRSVPVDFRLISATNRLPEAALKEGLLREDLYYRINTVVIHLAPLRERADDVPLLIEHFLSRFKEKYGKTIHGISDGARRALERFSWPGNVRELEHVMERAVLLARGSEIELYDLPEQVTGG